MAERVTSGQFSAGKPSLFNWLKWLDKEVRLFPSTADWLQHPPFRITRSGLFMMARYPHLQRPFPDEVLCREFSRGEHQISRHPEARHALDALNDRQKKEIAGLFLDIIESLRSYRADRRGANRAHKLARDAPRRTRMLTRKLENARRALEDLRKYAGRLDELLGWEYVRAAKGALERLRTLKENTASEDYQSVKGEYVALEDPVTLGMVQLYWFFRHGCGLPGDEAEVRVARIRNAFWTEHGVSKVPYRSKYQTGESKGCDAVHVAVPRFKQGTIRRKTP